MQPGANLEFTPKPIDAVGIRAGDGPNIRIAIGTIQRIAAMRAYNSYGNGRDWIDKVSNAYVVAVATRSADTLLMKFIQNDLNESVQLSCGKCKEASIGTSIIRERLFPTLKTLREHANTLIHHLDEPGNLGAADLDIQGIFDYCHHLFQDNIDALFGVIPSPVGKFSSIKCKSCSKSSPQ